jgi:hypothetical protein
MSPESSAILDSGKGFVAQAGSTNVSSVQSHARRTVSTRVEHDAAKRGGMKIRAAVIERRSGAFVLDDLELEDPRPDELLVRLVATGICMTDLHIRDQGYPVPLPVVAGHEGAGVVERVGEDVVTPSAPARSRWVPPPSSPAASTTSIAT